MLVAAMRQDLQTSNMRQALTHIGVPTQGQGLVEITASVGRWVTAQRIAIGILTIYCRHSSASLLIQENADPDVRADLEAFFRKVVPEGRDLYVHEDEGPDDMPAHIRAALTQTQLAIPVEAGRMLLGTWQGIYLFEHRSAPHRRELVLHLLGEPVSHEGDTSTSA
jgi:secondary thiamine-phosphate synthase enzyme